MRLVGDRPVHVEVCFAPTVVRVYHVQVIAPLVLNCTVVAAREGARCVDQEVLLLTERLEGTEQEELFDGIGRLHGRNKFVP